MHHTKDKGDLAVTRVIFELTKNGYSVFLPISEHCAFDLIAYKDLKCYRIQVKYRTMTNGCVGVKFATSWADKHGTHTQKVDKNESDYWCIYCPDNDKCYFVDTKRYGYGILIRIEASKAKNTNQHGYNLAKDFEALPC